MNERLESQLSALSDGETSELELRGLLKQLDDCEPAEREALLRKWGRYHVVGEVLAEERGDRVAASDFASLVARQIAGEPSPQHSNASSESNIDTGANVANLAGAGRETAAAAPSWSRFAVAASVALAVVVGVQQYQLNSSQGAPEAQRLAGANTAMPAIVAADSPQLANAQQAAGEAASQLALAEDLSPTIAPTLAPSKEKQAQALRAQQRLHEYMLEHANHAARQNGQGITPFARVANFEVQSN